MANQGTKRARENASEAREGHMEQGAPVSRHQVARTRLEILPEQAALTIGQSLQFYAIEPDGNGGSNVTAKVSWKSSSEAVVTIDKTGLAKAHQVGVAKSEALA